MNLRLTFRTLLLSTFLSTVLPAGTVTYALNETSTSGLTHGSGTGEAPRGWDFQVNATGLSVVQLGISPYLTIPMTVTLWQTATQTELAQVNINATAGAWTFVNLSTPVALTSGATYSVIGWANNPTSWYEFGSASGAFAPTGDIQFLQSRYDNGIDANTFPTGTLGGLMYGVPDIGYTTGAAAAPEPFSLSLAGAGLALLWFRRKTAR